MHNLTINNYANHYAYYSSSSDSAPIFFHLKGKPASIKKIENSICLNYLEAKFNVNFMLNEQQAKEVISDLIALVYKDASAHEIVEVIKKLKGERL